MCFVRVCKGRGANERDDFIVARARGNRECNRVQPSTTGYDPNWTRSRHDRAYDRPNYRSKPSVRLRGRVAPAMAEESRLIGCTTRDLLVCAQPDENVPSVRKNATRGETKEEAKRAEREKRKREREALMPFLIRRG